jgi:hypothetical protein
MVLVEDINCQNRAPWDRWLRLRTARRDWFAANRIVFASPSECSVMQRQFEAVLAAVLRQCRPLKRFEAPWQLLDPPPNCFETIPDENLAITELLREFPLWLLRLCGVIRSFRPGGRLRLAAGLAEPNGVVIALRSEPDALPFALLAGGSCLPQGQHPILIAHKDFATTTLMTTTNILYAAARARDVAILRALGRPAILLDDLRTYSLAALHGLTVGDGLSSDEPPAFMKELIEQLATKSQRAAAEDDDDEEDDEAESTDPPTRSQAPVGANAPSVPTPGATPTGAPVAPATPHPDKGLPADATPEPQSPPLPAPPSEPAGNQSGAHESTPPAPPGFPGTTAGDTTDFTRPPGALPMIAIVAFSVQALSPHVSWRVHSARRLLTEITPALGLDLHGLGVWQPTAAELANLRIAVRFGAWPRVIDWIGASSTVLNALSEPTVAPPTPPISLADARADLDAALNATDRGPDWEQWRTRARKNYRHAVERAIVDPARADAMQANDPVTGAFRLALASAVGHLELEGPLLAASLDRAWSPKEFPQEEYDRYLTLVGHVTRLAQAANRTQGGW